ncbi:hypothetical protein NMG29_26405 [Streptomyces cocklensis]|uniref:hypothetical protein n=1 Tax=Actinacidiphila cocklensis TaxID=887465 RepID=UPI00203B301C|nr:hypothetical protein [Actinacidiphila cocklensis]MDD1061706.1 hypothetical protein [Actinacidiphila cocklensis]
MVVGTAGRHLYLRRHTGTVWQWERVGTPPAAQVVRDASLLAVEASGALTAAVVDGGAQVWLYKRQAASEPWINLGGPSRDPSLPESLDTSQIVTSTTHHDTATENTLVVTSLERPWIHQGVEPDGTWFPITPDANLPVGQLASAPASVAPDTEPQQHIFALLHDRDSPEDSQVGVALRENSVWTWIDPGGPPTDEQDEPLPTGVSIGLSATSIRDNSGTMHACAVVGTGSFGETTISMLIGSGHDWRWVNLGRPPVPESLSAAVVADKGPDPRPGDEPLVVGRVGHTMWTRSVSGDWTDRGTTPGDVAVVDPMAAFEDTAATAQRRMWTAGVSSASELWTFASDEAGTRWEDHGSPGSVAALVGAYTDTWPDTAHDHPVRMVVIDGHGDLWSGELGAALDVGFGDEVNQDWKWSFHGRPAAAVTSAAGIGVLSMNDDYPQPTWLFVVGSDGHLWARTADAAGWAWVDHGTPGTTIGSGTPPIAVNPADGPIVHVLADDGRLWMRSRSGHEWHWSDRGTPPGQLIFAVVGAAALATAAGTPPLAVVVTGDGLVRVSAPDGAAFAWTDLGTPTPGEKIVAGIGVEVVTPGTVDIAAVGSPSGQVWTLRWTPGGTPQWTARGRPGEAHIQTVVGTMPDPANEGGCLVAVIGSDEQVWVTATTGPDQTWSRWDPSVPATTVLEGKAVVLLGEMPCSVVIDDRRRVHVVTTPRG